MATQKIRYVCHFACCFTAFHLQKRKEVILKTGFVQCRDIGSQGDLCQDYLFNEAAHSFNHFVQCEGLQSEVTYLKLLVQ
ncbi:hypothetical protein EUGRSUZ_D02053 [Eucalyptus grandis]|uniref:Uncharacterized protein n=2 Tax=Eucalyptus grandis TaxID=71139 RepID=A0ACC3L7Q4_EUCGR|nr:hypothetical protein EUGRSUZ_D02053 [Eucalyptus grandis]